MGVVDGATLRPKNLLDGPFIPSVSPIAHGYHGTQQRLMRSPSEIWQVLLSGGVQEEYPQYPGPCPVQLQVARGNYFTGRRQATLLLDERMGASISLKNGNTREMEAKTLSWL